jgi:hypothetical protein
MVSAAADRHAGPARPARPPVLEQERTGYLVTDVDAAGRAARLDRRDIHQIAPRRFCAARMVDDYLRIYADING